MNFEVNKISEKSLSRSSDKMKENKSQFKSTQKIERRQGSSLKLAAGKNVRVIEIDLRRNCTPKSQYENPLNINPPMIFKSKPKTPVQVKLSTQKIDKRKVESTIKKSKATYELLRHSILANETGGTDKRDPPKKGWVK